jgi:benzoate/toluate 1,2-dioxygenase reductase subunit
MVANCLQPRVPTPPVVMTTKLLNRRWLSESVVEIELSRPDHFFFDAGHTIQLFHCNQGRYYALVSATTDPHLTLCVNHIKAGYFSPLLSSAKIGFNFGLSGPHGYFTLSPSPRHCVFVATDTGVAPFVSMARTGVKGFTLFHGALRKEELYYSDILRTAAGKYLPITWDVSQDAHIEDHCFHGAVADTIAQNLVPGVYDFYLCGCMRMITDVTCLIDTHYPGSHVYTEVFYE